MNGSKSLRGLSFLTGPLMTKLDTYVTDTRQALNLYEALCAELLALASGVAPFHSHNHILLQLEFSIQVFGELLPHDFVVRVQLNELELKPFVCLTASVLS